MMDRIVAISNAMGESFQCLLPARIKPPQFDWFDIPQVPVVEDIDKDAAERSLRCVRYC